MLEKSLLKFAAENFSDKYCACLHGEINRIKPLALIVKRHRSMFKRPFGKHELIILEGLEKYVEGKGGEEFCKALNKIIAEEWLAIEPKLSLGERYESTLKLKFHESSLNSSGMLFSILALFNAFCIHHPLQTNMQ